MIGEKCRLTLLILNVLLCITSNNNNIMIVASHALFECLIINYFCRFLEYWVSDMIQLPFCWNAARTVAFILLPLLFSAAIGYVYYRYLLL